MNSDAFPERLKSIIGSMSMRTFGGMCELSEGAIRKYLSGQSDPSRTALTSMARVGGVSLEWLATGEGPRRRRGDHGNSQVEDGQTGYQYQGSPELAAGDEYVHLPLYNVRAAAGEGALVESEEVVDVLAFKAAWIRSELRLSPASLYLIYVEGESMEPTLRPGDLILVDRSATVRDGIYVLRIDDGLLVKRLQRLPGNQIDITSDNPAYKPFSLDLTRGIDGVDIVGRVVWSGRRM